MFSERIGPKIFSQGRHFFVEKFLTKLDIPDASTTDYAPLYQIPPIDGGTIAGHLFGFMHANNVIYDAWNWTDEVRLKVEKETASPMIVDFGSCLLWPES